MARGVPSSRVRADASFLVYSSRMAFPEEVFAYHERTKHHPHRYAASIGYMDWSQQPVPFRFFEGVPLISLPPAVEEIGIPYPDLYAARSGEKASALSVESLSRFLGLSLGLSAWKSSGNATWPLRMNPSSGNLHPTEAHLWLGRVPESELPVGCFHYHPLRHALERRSTASLGDALQSGFLLGLTSIYWRESWKYGERGFRYCQHDVGHAVGAIQYAAKVHGWKVTRLYFTDEELERLFGLDKVEWRKEEEEHVDLLLWIGPQWSVPPSPAHQQKWVELAKEVSFTGKPNVLSEQPLSWEVISEVSFASRRTSREPSPASAPSDLRSSPLFPTPSSSASTIIRQRRSAVSLDGRTAISRSAFLSTLARTLPIPGTGAFVEGMSLGQVHLFIFVHRVEGVAPGLYAYLRTLEDKATLTSHLDPTFLWKMDSTGHPLFLLREGDYRDSSKQASCHQDIAADGAFSLGMVARYQDNIIRAPHHYRELFWETGMIGQALYLEAEAWGVRGTGIGCYFDDITHGLLGISSTAYQCLYHFTVGGPVEDHRLATLPPYFHLEKGA